MKKFIALTVVFTAVIGLTLSFAGPERYSASKESAVSAVKPECDWSGFYIGINGGAATWQGKFTDLDYFEGFGTTELEDTTFTVGGQMGYNWQNGAFVWGLEVDADYLDAEAHRHTSFGNTSISDEWHDNGQLDFLGTLRGRAGIAVQNALVYVTAGGAYAHGEWDSKFLDFPEGNINDAFWTGDDWRWGWTAGVGAEYMFNCNWSARMEVLYTNLQDDTEHPSFLGPNRSSDDDLFRQNFDDEIWSVRVGLNYKFGNLFGH